MNTYDLIVVGGGIAGMVAGTRAAEKGLRVLVLEKGEAPDYRCNTRWSGGIVHVGYVDPKEPAANIQAGIALNTRGYTDPSLGQVLVEQCGKVIDWLRVQGVRFIRSGTQSYLAWTMAPPRALVAGIDWKGRGPDVMLRTLTERLRKFGGTLTLGAHADRLILENGAVTGVEATVAGTPTRFAASAVVIADGGFQSNIDLIRQHIMPNPEAVKQRGGATGMGDGMRMAREAGAAITDLDCFYGHLLHRESMVNDKVWPYPELDGIATAAIVVNHAGQRFVNEGAGGVNMANMIARGADPLCATLVLDTPIWEGPGRSARIPANPALERAGGTIYRAGTLRELAGIAGLDPDGLEATVAAYNKGDYGALTPPRTTDRFKPMPILKAPFVAIPACAGITYTMGGIRIDPDARVLSVTGEAIPGLYAAGAATGGIEGGPAIGYTGGLSKAAVFGFRAAEHVAKGARQ